MRRKMIAPLLVAAATLPAGCTYYRVTDPHTNRAYYTHNWDLDRYDESGAVQFRDQRTGRTVTLQNSEVEPISEDEYASGLESDG